MHLSRISQIGRSPRLFSVTPLKSQFPKNFTTCNRLKLATKTRFSLISLPHQSNQVKLKFSTQTEKQEDDTAISSFRISPETQHFLKAKGITHLFPIQYETFDLIYEGSDMIGRARTGTGKTIAFALPIVEKLKASKEGRSKSPKVLVLAPTRELAKQITDEFIDICGRSVSVTSVYGGTSYQPQENSLRRGVDVVVGTPGRLVDLVERSTLNLEDIEYVVLDEADEMLKIGFAEAIESLLSKITKPHQTLLFSATIPPWVSSVAKNHLKKDYKIIDLIGDEEVKSSETIKHYFINTRGHNKGSIVSSLISQMAPTGKVLVFTETKVEADNLASHPMLASMGGLLHGDISQARREFVIAKFRENRTKVLIATDVAARGLDIPHIDLVIQASPPRTAETYIHRVGRTGRAGKSGTAVTLAGTSMEQALLREYQKQTGSNFEELPPPTMDQDSFLNFFNSRTQFIAHKHVQDFTIAATKALQDQKDPAYVLAKAFALIAGHANERAQEPKEDRRRGRQNDRRDDRRDDRRGDRRYQRDNRSDQREGRRDKYKDRDGDSRRRTDAWNPPAPKVGRIGGGY